MTRRSTEWDKLKAAALALSDALHYAEQNGVELPGRVDRAWLHLTQVIEETGPQTGTQADGI